jgi:hypothetical protein
MWAPYASESSLTECTIVDPRRRTMVLSSDNVNARHSSLHGNSINSNRYQ